MVRIKWSKEKVISDIRTMAESDLVQQNARSSNPNLVAAARRYFGSWYTAVEIAGFDENAIRQLGKEQWSRHMSGTQQKNWSNDEFREKMSKGLSRSAKLKKHLSDELAKFRAAGGYDTHEFRIKSSRARRDKEVSEETRAKIGASMQGHNGATSDNRLTQEDATEIRRLWAEENHTQIEIANKFGVSKSMVSAIIRNKRWK